MRPTQTNLGTFPSWGKVFCLCPLPTASCRPPPPFNVDFWKRFFRNIFRGSPPLQCGFLKPIFLVIFSEAFSVAHPPTHLPPSCLNWLLICGAVCVPIPANHFNFSRSLNFKLKEFFCVETFVVEDWKPQGVLAKLSQLAGSSDRTPHSCSWTLVSSSPKTFKVSSLC